jgi:hypothetical protein
MYHPTFNFSSNFKPLDDEGNVAVEEDKPKYIKFDPEAPEPEIDSEEFKRMQGSLSKFSQAMSLSKYQVAQTILDEHKVDIEHYFTQEHPANISIINNQALLYKIQGRYNEAKGMFENVVEAYSQIYG